VTWLAVSVADRDLVCRDRRPRVGRASRDMLCSRHFRERSPLHDARRWV